MTPVTVTRRIQERTTRVITVKELCRALGVPLDTRFTVNAYLQGYEDNLVDEAQPLIATWETTRVEEQQA
jgi:hypothetical protein